MEETNNNAHFVEKERKYASKGVAGTALGLGIAGTALGLLNGGLGIFGMNQNQKSEISQKQYYEDRIRDMKELTQSYFALDGKMQLMNNGINERLVALEKDAAVQKAIAPLLQRITDMEINGVRGQSMSAIALEAEKRRFGDLEIVNYINSTFYPNQIADVTTSATTHSSSTYNPLIF